MQKVKCHISNKELPPSQVVKGHQIRPGILRMIQSDHRSFTTDSYISLEELMKYRKKFMEHLLRSEGKELSKLEKDVLRSVNENELLVSNIEPTIDSKLSFGDRLADRIATFGGSWTFIIAFFSFLILWMIVNIFILVTRPFDPYPFILLNLILSCLAAIQAPIIMMSQNRQEAKDRMRSEHDYKVNLKAELEIRLLHEKIDHLLLQQNQRLLEIQQLQVDLMDDILDKLNHKSKDKHE
ncbi:MAG TPA: DUF1003 domain-containing protein [Ohtaekwangia sp.]|uniref:DUF1003 domain-containing protein n=1 Tax=Ohtaekwangia sp. TaxID=2066019 RepID=UPI002F954208